MIGGPSDLVIEPNIVRASAAAPRETGQPRGAAPAEPGLRPTLEEPAAWPSAAQVEPALRPSRPPAEPPPPWQAAPAAPATPRPATARHESLADLADTLAAFAPPPRTSPTPAEAQPATPQAAASTLPVPPVAERPMADLAQRLDATLRRPVAEPRIELPPSDIRPTRNEPRPAPNKTFYESLEQEMASLLGRPSGKS
jgi:hypothetical protein